MRNPRVRFAVLAGAALAAASARADTPPNQWDIAKDPPLREHWALHVRVQRLLHPPREEEPLTRFAWKRDQELHCEAALALLQQAGADASPDARLRTDLGIVQYELAELSGRTDLYEKAATTLTGAVALAPGASFATEALERITYAYAKLDRPRDELEAWHRYIPKLVDPRTRTVALMNMGEAEMRMGKVDDALSTFHEVLRQTNELPDNSSTYVLGLWDLAVALDRSGDARGALDTATLATQQTAIDSSGAPRRGRDLLADDPNVFFVPDWERNWYLALADEALARQDTDLRDAAAHYARAESEWTQYVGSAGAALSAAARPDATGAPAARPVPSAALPPSAAAALQQWTRIAQLRHDRAHAALQAVLARLPRGVMRGLPAEVE